jgi:hypothetical protein
MKKILALAAVLQLLALAAAALVAGCSGSGGTRDPAGGSADENDTIAQATQLLAGTPVAGTISTSADVDVYALSVPAGGATVRIQTFDQGGVACDPASQSVDTFVAVYDAAGNRITDSDDTGPVRCEDFAVALAEGRSYVEVSGSPPVPFGYTLVVNVVSSTGPAGGTNPGEPNDTIGQATPMTVGTPIVGTISTESDRDVYSFTLPDGGATVRIRTFDGGGVDCDPTNEAVDTKIVVYDAAGAIVATSDDTPSLWCEDFAVALAAGTSYVEVGGWPPVPFVYTLDVRVR